MEVSSLVKLSYVTDIAFEVQRDFFSASTPELCGRYNVHGHALRYSVGRTGQAAFTGLGKM